MDELLLLTEELLSSCLHETKRDVIKKIATAIRVIFVFILFLLFIVQIYCHPSEKNMIKVILPHDNTHGLWCEADLFLLPKY